MKNLILIVIGLVGCGGGTDATYFPDVVNDTSESIPDSEKEPKENFQDTFEFETEEEEIQEKEDGCTPHIVGYYNLSVGFARDIFVSKNLLLVTDWYQNGLHIFDISNPTAPAFKGFYPTKGGKTWSVTASDNTAYLAAGKEGLLIIDVSDPANPTLKAMFDTPHAYNVFGLRERIYLIDFEAGLLILDVADPSKPFLLGEWPTVNLRDVFVWGNTAYLAGDKPIDAPKTGMQILDVSDPSHPYLKGILWETYGEGIFATKNYVFIACLNQGLKIINVAEPENPSLVSWFPLKNVTPEIFFSEEDKLGYLAASTAGLLMIDLGDFSTPTIQDQVDTDGSVYGLFVVGSLVYIADGEEGIKVIETCQCLPSCIGKQEGEADGCGGACL